MHMHGYTKSSKWIQALTEIVSLIYFYAGGSNGIFYFLLVPWIWFQGSDSKSNAVAKVFICHTDAKLVLCEVYIWKRRATQAGRPKHNV